MNYDVAMARKVYSVARGDKADGEVNAGRGRCWQVNFERS